MRTVKSILCVLMAISILLTYHFNFSIAAHAETDTIAEEKVTCTATLDDEFADNCVLVVFNNKTSLEFKAYTANDFAEIGCKSVKDLTAPMTEKVKTAVEEEKAAKARGLSTTAQSSAIIQKFNQIICLELEEACRENVLKTISKLEKDENIIYAGPDYFMTICERANDTYYSDQWGLQIIQAPFAWNITTGSNSVVVGVVDTGIKGNHPDLVDNIDSSLCRDFTGDTVISTGTPTDPEGHGTKVAGIIGAQGNNSRGVAGVCWDVTLVSLRILDANGSGRSSDFIEAVAFAENVGIPILNLSAGWRTTNDDYDVPVAATVRNYSGLLVCAAGNDASSNDQHWLYPASLSLPNVIAVGASTEDEYLYWRTNYGEYSVHLFAPGESIKTTSKSGGYTSTEGTSMATPFVAGVAALLLAKYPDLSACEIKDSIVRNVGDCGTTYDDKCISGGRLNAHKALSNVQRHNITSEGHTLTCQDCNYTYKLMHSFDAVQKYSANQHKLICSCGYIAYENHIWNTSHTKCIKCNCDINDFSVIDSISIDGKLHLLE